VKKKKKVKFHPMFFSFYYLYAGACGMDRRQNTYIMDKGFKGGVSNSDVLLQRAEKEQRSEIARNTKRQTSLTLRKKKKLKDHRTWGAGSQEV
jgi:hypothetical protein